MPQNAAGMRIEQTKSVPCAIGPMPVATATADPPEEPAGLSAQFHGLRVAPKSAFTVFAPVANSGVLVLPSTIAPAAARALSLACSAASVTMALSLGFTRAITARCASRTSTGLTARALIMAASSRAVFRVKLSSAIGPSLPRPVHELALDQQKQEIE